MNEAERLERFSSAYDPAEDFDRWMLQTFASAIRPLVEHRAVLELGCATGYAASLIVDRVANLDLVDGAQHYIETARRRISDPRVRFFTSLFEQFTPDRTYDVIICSHVLEHVEDPVAILQRARSWLATDGIILACVPNALSVHRRLGVQMGLARTVYELSERDRRTGHRRVYDPTTLSRDVEAAGLSHGELKGVFFKPLSSAQMEGFDESVLRGFMALGATLPALAAEIYYVCQPPRERGAP